MKPYVGSSGLAPLRHGELVPVGGQVAEPIQRRSRSVRDNPLIRGSLPGRNSGCKLKPRCPQVHVVRRRNSGQAIDARSDALENRAVGGESITCCGWNAHLFHLAAGHEAPLVFGDGGKSLKGGILRHGALWARNDGNCSSNSTSLLH